MIGRTLGNRYEIIKLIGNGGMANVYLAHDSTLNRKVAIKVLKTEYADDPDFLKRFITEAQAAAALNHPNIVSIYDYGREADLRYIVMEYVEGKTLKQYINENARLSWQVAVGYAIQMCKALEAAHRNGIVHRDIKPHNMILTNNGVIKVTDFGIARAASANTTTMTKDTTMGSVHYFSPEQARGGYTDAKSDIYSLGVVLYEMLTGRVPFDGDTPVAIAVKHIQLPPVKPTEIIPTIPVGVEAVVLKAMSKDPAQRYNSATEMLIDLQSVTVMPNIKPTSSKPNVINNDMDNTMKFDSSNVRKVPVRPQQRSTGTHRPQTTSSRSADKRKKTDDGKKEAVKWAVVTSVIIIALVIIGMSFVFGGGFGGKDNIVVPELVGEDYEAMVEKYKDSGITITIGQEVDDTDYDEGVITEQNPKAGKNVSTPLEIVVNVSRGVSEEPMKDYSGIKYEKVENELIKKGYKVKIEEEDDDDVKKDYVIRTSPAHGETIKKGDTVTLYVSTGKSNEEVTVPNVLGESESRAEQILKENDLTLGSVGHDHSSTVEKGRVMYQSHSQGTKLSSGSAVSITISDGPSSSNTSTATEAPVSTQPPADRTVVDGVGGGGMVEE